MSKPFYGYDKKRHAKTGGLNDKYREKVNRETGSNLKRPVTESNPGPKDAARRKSFCARMSGNDGPLYKYVDTDGDGDKEKKPTPKLMALKRWRCKIK
jgi:hypothetical protein